MKVIDLHPVRGCDYEAVLRETGIAALNAISTAAEVTDAVQLFASYVAELPAAEQHMARSEAATHLKTTKIPGAVQALDAELREARARVKAYADRTERAKSKVRPASTSAPEDLLPDGIDPFSDSANAHRIARDEGADLKHAAALGWLGWDGSVWKRDEGAAVRRAMEVTRRLMRFAVALHERASSRDEQEQADRYLAFARKSQGEPQIRHALELAKHLEPIAATPELFDAHPWLLSCANGTINLRNGELREHRREDLITRASPVPYCCGTTSAVFERFIADILPDQGVRAFVQRFAGYSLTGSTSEQCLAVLWGDGANGKSTLVEACKFVSGDYAREAAGETFLISKRGRSADNKLADLRGARFVTSSESGEGQRLDEMLIKRATGGDELTANHLYCETFRFHPQFKLWFASNHKPEVRGVDLGIWRRLRLIPFTVTIAPEQQDHELPAKLRYEASAILSWMVEGCLDWQQGGLRAPEAVLAATTEWRDEANDVSRFVTERCKVADYASAMSSALFGAFRTWATEQGIEAVTNKAFTNKLRALRLEGVSQKHTKRGERWTGLGLESEVRGET